MIFLIFLNCLLFLLKFSNSQECGRVKVGTSFSVGSEYAIRGQWPWLAPLFIRADDKFFCGSTIISKRHLLSASHCVKNKGWSTAISPNDIYAQLGKFDLDVKNEAGALRVDFISIKTHQDWDPIKETYDADVAILTLKDQITFNNFIQPVCLPEPSTNVFVVEGTVAGYGFSDETIGLHETKPKYVKIESVQQEDCLFSHEVFSRISSRRMFCAGSRGKNPCKGDSGGGFYVKSGNSYTILGIVSSSIQKECHENEYVLFTNVPRFINWIKNEMGSSSSDVDEWRRETLKCQYFYNSGDNRYECFSDFTLESTTPNVRINSIEGQLQVDPSQSSSGKKQFVTQYSDVDTINIKQSKVTYVPDLSHANQKFPNFNQLYIVLSGLKYIERSKLAKMPQLKVLNFFGNEIEHLEQDVFDDLKNLEILAFVQNKIKILPPKLVWNLINLKEIWSYDNPIEAIPIRFFKNNKNLEKAWMGYSKVKKIGVNFKALPNLNLLDLRSNSCIDEQGCSTCALSIADVQNKIDAQCS